MAYIGKEEVKLRAEKAQQVYDLIHAVEFKIKNYDLAKVQYDEVDDTFAISIMGAEVYYAATNEGYDLFCSFLEGINFTKRRAAGD